MAGRSASIKYLHMKAGVQNNSGIQISSICILLVVAAKKKEKREEEVATVVHIINNNKKKGGFFCLTGSSKPGAHLSGLSRLTFLQPNHFPLVPFRSRPFPLPLLLSSLILSPFLLLSQNHLLPTLSFRSLSPAFGTQLPTTIMSSDTCTWAKL